jgi:feruloyl-CoA synthase
VFLSPAGAQLDHDELGRRLRAAIAAHNAAHPQASERIARAILAREPLSLDDGETTDKGYTNQRRVLERRAGQITELFAEPAPAAVLSW